MCSFPPQGGGGAGAVRRDFPSDSVVEINLPAAPADENLPDIVVSGLPAMVNMLGARLLFKIRAIQNTNAAGPNAINGAQAIRMKKSTGTWGVNDIPALDLPDNLWTTAASTREPGDTLEGDYDLSSVVDGNGTYNFRFENAQVDLDFLRLNDVLIWLRLAYT